MITTAQVCANASFTKHFGSKITYGSSLLQLGNFETLVDKIS
jgi:hypothetical protein